MNAQDQMQDPWMAQIPPALQLPAYAVARSDTSQATEGAKSLGAGLQSIIEKVLVPLLFPTPTPPAAPSAAGFNIPPSLTSPSIGTTMSQFGSIPLSPTR